MLLSLANIGAHAQVLVQCVTSLLIAAVTSHAVVYAQKRIYVAEHNQWLPCNLLVAEDTICRNFLDSSHDVLSQARLKVLCHVTGS